MLGIRRLRCGKLTATRAGDKLNCDCFENANNIWLKEKSNSRSQTEQSMYDGERTRQLMMGGGIDWGWGWMFSSGLMMVLFWGGLIALVVLAVRGLSGGGTGRGEAAPPYSEARQTPLEIAQARYAKGEINRDEYETLRRDLQTS